MQKNIKKDKSDKIENKNSVDYGNAAQRFFICRKLLMGVISLLAAGMFGMLSLAAEPPLQEEAVGQYCDWEGTGNLDLPEEEAEGMAPEDCLGPEQSAETLFDGYAISLFYENSGISLLADFIPAEWTERDLAAYAVLEGKVSQVAAGETVSTLMQVPLEDVGIPVKESFTTEELGVSSFVENGQITAEAKSAVNNLYQETMKSVNFKSLMKVMLINHPYEMYWYDKVNGYVLSYPGITMSASKELLTITYSRDYFQLAMSVNNAFLPEEYRVYTSSDGKVYPVSFDASGVEQVKQAVQNASAVLERNRQLGDYEKLEAYKEELRSLASYDHDAAQDDTWSDDSNPWQLIYVFDGDPDTNVVCEGYAKAFQYLCDRSAFDSDDVFSYIVYGKINGGNHMWNQVHMEDDRTYLADVTNCHLLKEFLSPAESGSVNNGYRVARSGGGNALYTYNADVISIYGSDYLALSDRSYEKIAVEPVLAGVSYTLDSTIALNLYFRNVSGNGKYTVRSEEESFLPVSSDAENGTMFRIPLAAKKLNGEIEFALYRDGIPISFLAEEGMTDRYSFSMGQYRELLAEQRDRYEQESRFQEYEDLMGLVDALMQYGEAAEGYFNGETETVQEQDFSFEGYAAEASGELPDGITYCGSSVLLEEDTVIRHYFCGSAENWEEIFSAPEESDWEIRAMDGSDNLFCAEKNGITAACLDQIYRFTMRTENGSWSLAYSAFSYGSQVMTEPLAVPDGGTGQEEELQRLRLKRLLQSLGNYCRAAQQVLTYG